MLWRFSLYGFLKNQRYFEPFLLLAFLDKGISFAVFGLLIDGFDVLDRIGSVEVEEAWEGEVAFHRPLEPVTIKRAYLENRAVTPE